MLQVFGGLAVHTYDRRGRGESGDTQPYAVAREVEDLEALIDEAGPPACLYGHSSGGALVLEAALAPGDKVKKIPMYEVPYSNDEGSFLVIDRPLLLPYNRSGNQGQGKEHR